MSQCKHSFYLSWWLVKYAMEHDKVKEQKQRNRCEGRKSNSQGKICIVVDFVQSYKEYIHVQI